MGLLAARGGGDRQRGRRGRWNTRRPHVVLAFIAGFLGLGLGYMDLHSEPDHVFFDIVHAASGAIALTPIPLPIELSGNEHFVIE
jgi:hypothetical protein